MVIKFPFLKVLAVALVIMGCSATIAGGAAQAEAAEPCDLALGAKIFSKCAACHTFDTSGIHGAGPNLNSIIGKPSGSSSGFPYSEAMQAFQRLWTESELDSFLQQPMAAIPGTTMAFGGLAKPHQRAAVICYLAQGAD